MSDQGTTSNGAVRVWKGVQVGITAEPSSTDIDERLRCLQQELDRVAHSSNPGINSSVLHSAPQHYPTSTLRLELEAEIDRLLREQVSFLYCFSLQSVLGKAVLSRHPNRLTRHTCFAVFSVLSDP